MTLMTFLDTGTRAWNLGHFVCVDGIRFPFVCESIYAVAFRHSIGLCIKQHNAFSLFSATVSASDAEDHIHVDDNSRVFWWQTLGALTHRTGTGTRSNGDFWPLTRARHSLVHYPVPDTVYNPTSEPYPGSKQIRNIVPRFRQWPWFSPKITKKTSVCWNWCNLFLF